MVKAIFMKKDQLPKNWLVYLEAFPFYHSILDLCHLEAEEREFAKLLVEQLLSGKMDLNFQGHSQSAEKLHHLYFDSRNLERTGGQRCSALGFPLLLFKQESSVRMVPLLLWPLNIDPDQHRPHFWSVRSVADRAPRLNPLLQSLFPEKGPVPPPPWKSSKSPDLDSVQTYGKQLAAWLETTWQETWNEPFPVPPLEVLGDLAGQRVILPCMVLGSFKPAFASAGDEGSWAPEENAEEVYEAVEVEDTLDPPPDGIHPLCYIVGRLWDRKSDDTELEIFLAEGEIVSPELYSEVLSIKEFGVFGSKEGDGTYSVTIIPWTTVRKIGLRKMPELSDKVFR